MDQGDLLFGVSQAELMEWCDVDRTTATRWKKGQSRAPGAALKLVRLRVYGEADALLGDAWRGWRFGNDGLLYAPGWRRGFMPGELLWLPLLHGQISDLRQTVSGLEQEVKNLTSRLAASLNRADWFNRRARRA